MSKRPVYTDNVVYQTLEQLCIDAGVSLNYVNVQSEIFARAQEQAQIIEMPENDTFDNPEHAALVLGHEMGHVLMGPDMQNFNQGQRVLIEAECDRIGVYLYRLAEMIAGENAERPLREAALQSAPTE